MNEFTLYFIIVIFNLCSIKLINVLDIYNRPEHNKELTTFMVYKYDL
jgi:hypothetical protein